MSSQKFRAALCFPAMLAAAVMLVGGAATAGECPADKVMAEAPQDAASNAAVRLRARGRRMAVAFASASASTLWPSFAMFKLMFGLTFMAMSGQRASRRRALRQVIVVRRARQAPCRRRLSRSRRAPGLRWPVLLRATTVRVRW